MKSILLYAANDSTMNSRMQVALDIARRTDAHLAALHVEPHPQYVAIEVFGAAQIIEDVLTAGKEQAESLRKKMDKDLTNESVKWDLAGIKGFPVDTLIEHSRFADLVVMSIGDEEAVNRNLSRSMVGEVALGSGRPLLAVPAGIKELSFERAMIAYDGTPPSANAIRGALPMLRLAETVELVEIEEKDSEFPMIDAAEYLSRHDITCDVTSLEREGRDIADILSEHAAKTRAGYLVMGAYGHSRLRQTLFGGVTKQLLSESKVPLLLSA